MVPTLANLIKSRKQSNAFHVCSRSRSGLSTSLAWLLLLLGQMQLVSLGAVLACCWQELLPQDVELCRTEQFSKDFYMTIVQISMVFKVALQVSICWVQFTAQFTFCDVISFCEKYATLLVAILSAHPGLARRASSGLRPPAPPPPSRRKHRRRSSEKKIRSFNIFIVTSNVQYFDYHNFNISDSLFQHLKLTISIFHVSNLQFQHFECRMLNMFIKCWTRCMKMLYIMCSNDDGKKAWAA